MMLRITTCMMPLTSWFVSHTVFRQTLVLSTCASVMVRVARGLARQNSSVRRTGQSYCRIQTRTTVRTASSCSASPFVLTVSEIQVIASLRKRRLWRGGKWMCTANISIAECRCLRAQRLCLGFPRSDSSSSVDCHRAMTGQIPNESTTYYFRYPTTCLPRLPKERPGTVTNQFVAPRPWPSRELASASSPESGSAKTSSLHRRCMEGEWKA